MHPHGPQAAPRTKLREGAFYDLDGTLVRGNILLHYLFYAVREPTPVMALERLVRLGLRLPGLRKLSALDRRTFNEAFYAELRGISQDRFELLKNELFEKVTRPAIFPGVPELIAADKRAGRLTVLVTGALEVVAEPVARHLGIERVIGNRLVYDKEGIATGELRPPIVAGPAKVAILRELAAQEGLDLGRSRAYADDAADIPFLSAVGYPTAMTPEPKLRATAKAHGWPILDLDRDRKPASFFDRALDGALAVARVLEAAR